MVFGKSKFSEWKQATDIKMKPWWDSLEKESDRAVAIIAVCLLDTLLEELIRAYYIKERRIVDLFRDDHILKTFFAKINIAYYSGFIPKVIYHDLKTICKIRNRFAHTLSASLDFTESAIVQLLQECELRPKTMDDVFAPKIKYLIIVQQVAAYINFMTNVAREIRPPLPVEFWKDNERDFSKATLTKSQIEDIIRKARKDGLSEQ